MFIALGANVGTTLGSALGLGFVGANGATFLDAKYNNKKADYITASFMGLTLGIIGFVGGQFAMIGMGLMFSFELLRSRKFGFNLQEAGLAAIVGGILGTTFGILSA